MSDELFTCAETDSVYLIPRRRQVAGPGHNAHSASGASKADDSPEDDDEDRLEYDLERYLLRLNYLT